MRHYFSGIGRPSKRGQLSAEFLLLRRAEVTYILVDQFRLQYLGDYRRNVSLDCGSYLASKQCIRLELPSYLETAQTRGPFDFTIALDAFQNPALTYAYWEKIKRLGRPENMMPVWQWNAPQEHLEEFLAESEKVAIGGLVPALRARCEKTRAELINLCAKHPNRFHILGLCWARCYKDLKDTAYSADSSLWLDAARKNTVFFHNTQNGHLSQMPMSEAISCGVITEPLNREERLVFSARQINGYCN